MRLINITPWQESGAMVHGEIPIAQSKLNYAVAVVNGMDQDYIASAKPRDARQVRENNDNKMLGGRLGYLPIPELEIGVSAASGKYDNNAQKNILFTDFDISFDLNDFSAKGEYVESKSDDLTTTKEIKSSGFYVHAAYKLLKDMYGINYLEPAVRYDEITAGRTMRDTFTINPALQGKVSRISIGLNLSPRKHYLIKLEYGMTAEEKTSGKLDNDAFYTQFCVDF